jgi:hypothetical protein
MDEYRPEMPLGGLRPAFPLLPYMWVMLDPGVYRQMSLFLADPQERRMYTTVVFVTVLSTAQDGNEKSSRPFTAILEFVEFPSSMHLHGILLTLG